MAEADCITIGSTKATEMRITPPAQRRLGPTVLGLVDIANPQGFGHPRPTAFAFIGSLVTAPLFVGRAGVSALLRRLGLKQWRARF